MRTKSGVKFDVITYDNRYFEDVKALWCEALVDQMGWRAPEFVIPAKIAIQPELFLIAVNDGRVIGTTMAGYDGHRGWLCAVAVRQAFRRAGVGSALLKEAEKRLVALGCPKINLQVLAANASAAAFYETLGYAIEERISMGKTIGAFARERAP